MADIESPDRVGVKVWPDARDFLRDLRKTLKKVEKAVKVNVPLVADAKRLAGEAKAATEAAERGAGKISVPAGLEDGFIAQMRRDLKKAMAQVEASVPLTADGERLRRDARAKVAELEAAMRTMEASVPLDPEFAAAQKADLKREIAEMQAIASADPVEVPVKVDVDKRALAQLRSTFDGMRMPSMPALPALTALPKAAAIAAIGIAAMGSLPAVAALTVGIGQMAGVLLALPAVGVGAIASVAAIAIGVSGLGDAFKAAGEGGEAYEEAMSNLAPSARSFVTSVRSLGDGFSELRLDVQGALFRGIGAEVKALGTTYLPTLRNGLAGTAESINGVVREWSAMARSEDSVSDTSSMFDSINSAIGRASGGVTDFSAGLRRLATIGAGVLPDLSDEFTKLGAKFDAWTKEGQKSGSIEESMRRGGQAARDLGSIIGSLGSIIGGVFTALSDAVGGNPLGSLEEGLSGVAKTVQGPAFQTGLTTFFAGMRDGWKSIAGGLGDFGSALGEIAPGLADFARAFGAGFGTVLSTVAKVISDNKDTINSFFQAFADASPKVQGLVVGFMLLAPVLMSAVSAVVGFVAGIAAIGSTGAIIAAVVAAVVAVGAAFAALYQKSAPVREAFASIGALLQQVGAVVLPLLQQAFATLAPVLVQIGAAVAQLAGAIAERLMPVFQFLTPYIQTAFTALVTVIKGALTIILGIIKFFAAVLKGDWSAAWSALGTILSGVWMVLKGIVTQAVNGIKLALTVAWAAIRADAAAAWARIKAVLAAVWAGIRAVVVGAIVVVRAQITTGWAVIRAVTSAAWSAIKGAVSAAWSAIRSAVSAAVSAVRSTISSAWAAVRAVTSAAWTAVKSFVTAGVNGAKSAVTSAVAAIRSAITSAWASVRSATSSAWNTFKSTISAAINSAKSAVSSGISSVVSTIRGLPGKITSALGNLGGLLKNAGRELIQGLINGITEKIGALQAKMSEVASKVKGFMPGSPVKEGPLRSWNYGGGVSAAGRRLIGGLADGMDAELRSVAAASRRVAHAANAPTESAAAAFAARPTAGEDLERALSGWQPVVNLDSRKFYGSMKRVTKDRKGR